MNRIRTVLKLLLPVLCLLAGSCGYQLGGTKPPKLEFAQTVKVDLFANNSLEPRAATLVTGALADELQRDGTYRLSSRGNADIRVQGEVYSISFDQLRSSREDTYKSSELGLRLSVNTACWTAGRGKSCTKDRRRKSANSLTWATSRRRGPMPFPTRRAWWQLPSRKC